MKNKARFFIAFILATLSVNHTTGQETNFASNVRRYPISDEKQLVIKYDLVFPDTTQLFDIILNLYYNGKLIQPNENALTGSWGNKVAPGKDLVILWDFPNEFNEIINKVTVDVVASKRIETLADFTYKILSKKAPFDVKFENKSKNADIYSWKFGDLKSGGNNLSSQENPVHNYKSPGKYEVELSAGNSKTNESHNILKPVSIGNGNEEDLKKHKTLRTIWLGSFVASAGAGTYFLVESHNLFEEYKTTGDKKLDDKSDTYMVIGTAALVVSGVCISQVIIQSIKIQKLKQSVSLNLIPLDRGAVVGLAWNF
jgi:hypothetical protein